MSEISLPERMRKIALDLPVPNDLTNREYWLRTEILEWADKVENLQRECDLYSQLAVFKDAKSISFGDRYDYGLAIYTLRDLPLTKEFGLDDLAWAHHKGGNTSKSDWEYFRDEWLKRWRDELVAVQEKAGCDPYQEEGQEPWERKSTQEESEA